MGKKSAALYFEQEQLHSRESEISRSAPEKGGWNMIAVCPNKECNQRYRIRSEMIGRIAKCKKCNNPFKIEELIFSPKPLEFNPIDNDSVEQTKKNNSNTKLESETTLPSSETESPRPPLTQGSKKTVCSASSLIVIVVLGIAAFLFIRNIHKR